MRNGFWRFLWLSGKCGAHYVVCTERTKLPCVHVWDGFSSPSFFYSHRTPTWRPFEIRGSGAAAATIYCIECCIGTVGGGGYVKSVKSMHRSDFTCAWLYRYSVCQWDRHTKRAYFRLHCKPNTVQEHLSGTHIGHNITLHLLPCPNF